MTARRPTEGRGLAPRRLGVFHLVFFTVAASAPLTVLGGGVTTMFAVSGNVGAPLVYIVLAVVLAVFAVGYAAMSRHVSNAGAFYSYIANGLGRATGVSASFVALTAYNAIQIGLYGLFGAVFGDFVATKFGVEAQWWVWGLVAMALVGLLGVLRVDLNANVLAVLLVLECVAVAVYDAVALGNPAGGTVTLDGLDPQNLFAAGFGAVLAFGIASFTGFESGAIYSEEVKDPRRTVARATYVTVAFTGLFYAFSAWAMTVVNSPGAVVQAAAEAGPGLVFAPLAEYAGTVVADAANVLFITSVFAALLSFHNGVARYLFALGRERVLPGSLGRAGITSGAPVAGSLTQTVLALGVVLAFVATGRDPVVDLFTWLSGVAAVGVVALMAGTSAAVVGFFGRRVAGPENAWQRVVAPSLATLLLTAVLAVLVVNFDSLLAPDAAGYLRWLLPGLVGIAAVTGLVWGLALRGSRPQVYQGIGRAVDPLTAADEPEYEPIPR